MFILLYRILVLPVFLLLSPYYITRMVRRGGYSENFKNRFGILNKLAQKQKKRVWIHAVSLGEVGSARAIVEELAKNNEVILTTTTSTGYDLAKRTLADKLTYLGYFPIDFWLFSWITWKTLDADVVIHVDGDLWPEHLTQARSHGVPIVVINARLSDKSYSNYKKLGIYAGWIFNRVRELTCSSFAKRDMFIELGMDEHGIHVLGDLKCDVTFGNLLDDQQIRELKKDLGFEEDSFVIMGSSTWPGEEQFLAEALAEMRKTIPQEDVRILVVPRHGERREEIESMLKAHEVSYHLRSWAKPVQGRCDYYLGDTHGEMRLLMQAADVVFVGKSLKPNEGGQTPIEAAALGKPLVYGPRMSNFKDICKELEAIHASKLCDGTDAVKNALDELVLHEELRNEMGHKAKELINASRGATERTVKLLKQKGYVD